MRDHFQLIPQYDWKDIRFPYFTRNTNTFFKIMLHTCTKWLSTSKSYLYQTLNAAIRASRFAKPTKYIKLAMVSKLQRTETALRQRRCNPCVCVSFFLTYDITVLVFNNLRSYDPDQNVTHKSSATVVNVRRDIYSTKHSAFNNFREPVKLHTHCWIINKNRDTSITSRRWAMRCAAVDRS